MNEIFFTQGRYFHKGGRIIIDLPAREFVSIFFRYKLSGAG